MPASEVPTADRPQFIHDQLSLADALDRILHRGVTAQGNLTIGLADVDLLFLDVRLLLGAIDTIWPEGAPATPLIQPPTPSQSPASPPFEATPSAPQEPRSSDLIRMEKQPRPPLDLEPNPRGSSSSTAQGLIRLVLTLVKLLHDVLERQAVRRMDAGRLTDAQIENLGTALFAQAEEISRLQLHFGLSDNDISLELGVPDGAL